MSEIQPPEETLASYFIEQSEKVQGFLKDDERVSLFITRCLHETLAIVNEWLEHLPAAVRTLFLENSSAKNTLTAYQSDLEVFYLWCFKKNKCALPCSAVDLVEFLVNQSADGFAMSTVNRRASSISWLHRKAGFLGPNNPRESAFVKEAIKNLKRVNRDNKPKQAKELTTDIVREMVRLCEEDTNPLRGARNKALVLIGFASALRRENLASIAFADINVVDQGLEIYVHTSKTDQTGRGHVVRLARGQVAATCPVKALLDWATLANLESGYVFRRLLRGGHITEDHITGKSILNLIKEQLQIIDAENYADYSAHSLRSGFASTAAQNGASIQAIKTQGNWKSDGSLMKYIRNKENWDVAASYKLGL